MLIVDSYSIILQNSDFRIASYCFINELMQDL